MRSLIISAFAIASALPAAAQEDVERRTFTFLGDDLVIDIVADGPGTLRLVRAGHGTIEVVGRAERALLGFGAPDRPEDPLRLTALGRGDVDWLVTVPAGVRVQVRTPGADHVRSVTADDMQTWHWRGAAPVRRTRARPPHVPDTPAFAFTDRSAPDTLLIDSPAGLNRLVVRIEGETFGVAGSDRLAIQRQGPGRIILTPLGDRPLDLLVVLAANAPAPVLLSAGQSLLVSRAGGVDTTCEPVSVVRADGVSTLTFTPIDGVLRC